MSPVERGPLAGCSVLVPRAEEQAPALSGRVRALGGEPVEAPTIEIVDGDRQQLADAVAQLAAGDFGAVCFTSPNGVRAVAGVLAPQGDHDGSRDGRETSVPPERCSEITVAVVGPGTARVLTDEFGRQPDLMPETSTTAQLGAAFPASGERTGSASRRILLPRADIASAELPDALAAKGYEPVVVTAYRTVTPEGGLPRGVIDRLASGEVDLLAFTSSSTVRNFAELIGERSWRGRVVAIGPVTAATCREFGIEVAVVADQHDLDGLIDALVHAWRTASRVRGG